jgi:ABC-2 type transport system permease protein
MSLLGHYAALPPAPLAALAVGQSDVMPSYYRVTAHPAYTFLTASEINNPLNTLTGSFDVGFVIVFILPIVIIALTFDLVSREKEMGVLGLVAASGVSLASAIFAKTAARAALLLAALIVMAGVIMLLGKATALLPLALWFGVVVLYALFWFALALAVNATNRPSVTNGVILANVWLVFVVVLPAFVNVAANTLYPAPSRVALTTEMREATEEADEQAAGAREAFFFDHPEMAGQAGNADAYFLQVLATNAAVERAVAPLLKEFDTQAEKRDAVVETLQYLSPAILTQQALAVISGTDSARFAEFTRQVTRFHARWRGFFQDKIVKGERMTAADFEAIPAFGYTDGGLAWPAVLKPLAALTLVTMLLLGWSAQRLRRFPVV